MRKRMPPSAKSGWFDEISPATLAYGIGVSDGFISQVESPKSPSKYNLNHLNEIAKYLGCSPRDFLPEKPL